MTNATTSLDDRVRMLHLTMDTFADAKRFNELWLGNPGFRTGLFRNPAETMAQSGLDLTTDDVRDIIATSSDHSGTIARGMFAITAAKAAVMKQWYGPEAATADPRIAAWKQRRMNRMRLELGPFPANSAINGSWHAELTRGCSGGCWFCNMAAADLDGVAPAGDDALAEWRDIVRMLVKRLGTASRTGFLDGATDPLDHPAYEQFARIVHEEAGFYPPTATALALRDPDRTRRFFRDAKEAGCWSLRLTVRTQDELAGIHQAFSSHELSHVQVNVMTPESPFVYSLAGRFRDRYLADEKFAAQQHRKLQMAPWFTSDPSYEGHPSYPFDGNTAVIGFSVDLVDRSVGLVVPRAASDRFPLGLEVLQRTAFADAASFGDALDALVVRWMPLAPGDAACPRLCDWLDVERRPDGVRVHGRFSQSVDIVDETHGPLIERMADILQQAPVTVAELPHQLEADRGVIEPLLQRFFDAGLIEEEAVA